MQLGVEVRNGLLLLLLLLHLPIQWIPRVPFL